MIKVQNFITSILKKTFPTKNLERTRKIGGFQKLSPVIIPKKDFENKSYKIALDFAFKENELRNIAISGAYGAGKSSIFESYLHHWKRKEKVLRISLAHFGQPDTCSIDFREGIKTDTEKNLEAKIINQLIHQIDPENIKKTRFVAHITTDVYQQVLFSTALTLTILIAGFLFLATKIKNIIAEITFEPFLKILSFLTSADGLTSLGIILVILLLGQLFKLIFLIAEQNRGNGIFSKLSIKNISLELFNDQTESFFDKYLSEIRYLFENSDARIVVIDDIDRYFCKSIFEKIRELNTIINFDKKFPIKFFYIIKDDLFESKDRTKFFDFIIPIIPIVDASNSYGQLRSLLLLNEADSNLNKRFLRGLSFFIDDMRVLKNIINEFTIYSAELRSQHLDQNKLLAFITYKNLFPEDFNELQLGTGYLYEVLQSRDKLSQSYIDKKNAEIQNINETIKEIEKEHLQNIEELGSLFIKPIQSLEMVNGKRVDSFGSILLLFKELTSNPSSIHIFSPNGRETYNFQKSIDNLQNNPEFKSRKLLLEMKSSGEINNLENKKKQIELDIQEIKESHAISSLINFSTLEEFLLYPVSVIPETNTAKKKKFEGIIQDIHFPIVRFLVENGMIDGYYKDYLTYFYETEIKLEDQRFVKAVFDKNPLSMNHTLSNPEGVLEMLGYISETNPAYINFSLFRWIIDAQNVENSKNFIKLLRRNKNSELINDYLQSGKEIQFLIGLVNFYWETFFVDTNTSSPWQVEQINQFLLMQLIFEKPEYFLPICEKNGFSVIINTCNDLFANIDENDEEKVIDNLTVIGAKFEDIRKLRPPIRYTIRENKIILPFLDSLYKNNLYKISIHNICKWLELYYDHELNNQYERILSIIFSKPSEPLYSYVSDHLDDLINDIFINSPEIMFTDNQDTISLILNSDSTSFETKSKYIEKLKLPVKNIYSLKDNGVIILLLEKDKIVFDINNVFKVFIAFENTLPEQLLFFLDKHKNDPFVGLTINSDLYSNEVIQNFYDSILEEQKLSQKSTTTLLKATKIKNNQLAELINKDKAMALILSHSLIMNKNNLGFIRENYPELIFTFEKINLREFKALLSLGESTTPQEIINLLESDLNGNEQRNLLRCVTIKIPFKTTYRFKSVKKIIITSLLDPEDLQLVVNDPETNSQEFKRTVLDAIYRNLGYAIQNEIQIPYDCFLEIINEKKISGDNLIELFINSIKNYSPENIRAIILQLDLKPFKLLYEGKRPKLENTVINNSILLGLQAKGIVSQGKDNQLYLLKGNKTRQ